MSWNTDHKIYSKRSTDNCYIKLYASERTRRSLSDSARRQRANHELACSWRLPATNAKGAQRISHGAANNRLTIGRYGNSEPNLEFFRQKKKPAPGTNLFICVVLIFLLCQTFSDHLINKLSVCPAFNLRHQGTHNFSHVFCVNGTGFFYRFSHNHFDFINR